MVRACSGFFTFSPAHAAGLPSRSTGSAETVGSAKNRENG